MPALSASLGGIQGTRAEAEMSVVGRFEDGEWEMGNWTSTSASWVSAIPATQEAVRAATALCTCSAPSGLKDSDSDSETPRIPTLRAPSSKPGDYLASPTGLRAQARTRAHASKSSVHTYCVTLCATFTHTQSSSPSRALSAMLVQRSAGESHLPPHPASRSTVPRTRSTIERCRRTLFVARCEAEVVLVVRPGETGGGGIWTWIGGGVGVDEGVGIVCEREREAGRGIVLG